MWSQGRLAPQPPPPPSRRPHPPRAAATTRRSGSPPSLRAGRAAAHLEQRNKAAHVRLDVRQRLLERVAHARLCAWGRGAVGDESSAARQRRGSRRLRCEVDDVCDPARAQQQLEQIPVAHVPLEQAQVRAARRRLLAQVRRARRLEPHVVVVVKVVEADDRVAVGVQLPGRVVAHEARHPGQQHHAAVARAVRLWQRPELLLDPPVLGVEVLGRGPGAVPHASAGDQGAREEQAAALAKHAAHNAVGRSERTAPELGPFFFFANSQKR